MAATGPVFNQFNLVVTDMEASLRFYRRLGLTIPEADAQWANHHRTATMPNGIDLDFDSVTFAQQWNRGWQATGGGAMGVLGFGVPSRDAVDALYADVVGAGYTSQQPPYDAFWGARYAVVEDPDGNAIGLMSPVDPERRTQPPKPKSGRQRPVGSVDEDEEGLRRDVVVRSGNLELLKAGWAEHAGRHGRERVELDVRRCHLNIRDRHVESAEAVDGETERSEWGLLRDVGRRDVLRARDHAGPIDTCVRECGSRCAGRAHRTSSAGRSCGPRCTRWAGRALRAPRSRTSRALHAGWALFVPGERDLLALARRLLVNDTQRATLLLVATMNRAVVVGDVRERKATGNQHTGRRRNNRHDHHPRTQESSHLPHLRTSHKADGSMPGAGRRCLPRTPSGYPRVQKPTRPSREGKVDLMRHANGDTMHLKDRADHLQEVVHERTAALGTSGKGRRHKKARKNLHKLERKLEEVSKRLPVETALDRKRRRRMQKRSALGGVAAAAVALVAGGIAFILRKPRDGASDAPGTNGSAAAATPPMPARTAPH